MEALKENDCLSTKIIEELPVLLECDDCDQTFENKKSLIKHVKQHHAERGSKCTYCDDRVKKFTDMKHQKKLEYVNNSFKESLIQMENCLFHKINNRKENL